MGRLFHSLPEGPLCIEEHLLLGHFRGALVSQLLPTQQAGLVSCAPPTHPALQEHFREKIDTCTSLEKAPSVVFSTGPLSSPRKENNVWTDNSSKHCDHSCTAPAVRWTLHTSFPQASDPHDCLTHPRRATDILVLQMQKPSRESAEPPGHKPVGQDPSLEPGQNWGSVVHQPFTPQMC